MVVLIDTGVLVGAIARNDEHHARCQRILDQVLDGQHGALVTTDHVLSEGLTLLRRRPANLDVSRGFADLLLGPKPAFRMRWTDEATMRHAVTLHLKLYPRRLSLVDCTLLAHAEQLGASIATIDAQFAGLADVIT